MARARDDQTPHVSVCVSTRNRAARLPGLLEHLERQTLDRNRFEVVIVDDGSTDHTAAVLDDIRRTSPLHIRVLRNDTASGAAAGRNRAWRAARGRICAFTDDDCMPQPNWLQAGLDGMGHDAVIGAGAVRWPPSQQRLLGVSSRALTQSDEIAHWCATANLFVRRDDLAAVDGFDEVQLRIAGEDTDMALRVMATGVGFRYLADALVLHHVELVGLRGLLRDQRRYLDLPLVFRKNRWAKKGYLRHGVFWKPTHERVLLLFAGVAIAPWRVEGLALAVPWLHERLCGQPLVETLAERVLTLPMLLVLDTAEVLVMVRGSIRHRELVL
jgi:glycosyltransferase involved in cell wall biosynthesis